jgi:DinB superfamily
MSKEGEIVWAERVLAELDEADHRARALTSNLSEQQLNWRPSPDEWSIGQCLHHLLVFNRLYVPAISRALDDQTPHPVSEVTPGWVGGWFMRTYVEPGPNTRRLGSPQKINPEDRINPCVVDDFLRCNQHMKDTVRRAAEYDVNRIRYKNPLVPLVRFTVGVGLELTWKHQFRHLLQAERVKQSRGFPTQ